MKAVLLSDFQSQMASQGVPQEHIAFVCPMCKTVQSMTSLIKAGAEDVERYIGFSCVGRWAKPGEGRKAFGDSGTGGDKLDAGIGCDWTLGGLLQMHKIEVEMPDGKRRRTFELATPEQAKQLMENQ